MSGKLISIEGGEGAGKSTVIATIVAVLEQRGLRVQTAREPGGTALGEAVRELVLGPVQHSISAEAELLLMFAARAQLVRERVLPALAAGDWVVSDRFTDASFAYQGGGRGVDSACIAELERWVVGFKPDITFLLDVCVDIGMQRARGRGGALDRIESEASSFFERARVCYRQRAAAEPARYRVIDAGQPVAVVVDAVQQALQAWLDAQT
ncbi:MAG: dTMP kinase [Lysobacterales bacterium CG17_big_fil_post_rev_8_21_14_2_50_64_11]|nr:MAG: dTMP kinase [Xanthomonadales bacterium CG17_big_fil_post_rev_8_21_14_2_50_64_11]PIX61116.1 MAG: dTMP kinase [Xanthomonadales bacterium CG_4_10_14_3_um_filter_64_11]